MHINKSDLSDSPRSNELQLSNAFNAAQLKARASEDSVISSEKLGELDALYDRKYKEYIKENQNDPNVNSQSSINFGVKATRSELGAEVTDRMNEILKQLGKDGRDPVNDNDSNTITLGEYIEVKRYIISNGAYRGSN